MKVFTHEFLLLFYGVGLWRIEQILTKPMTFSEHRKRTAKSMAWGAIFIVWDDEIADIIQHFTSFPIEIQWYHYIVVGFFI